MKYYPATDDPYRVFIKGKKEGVINTNTKEVVIPAKNAYIQQHFGVDNFPSKPEEKFFVVDQKNKHQLYNTKGKIIYNFKDDEYLDRVIVYNKKIYLITDSPKFFEGNTDTEIQKNKKLILLDENQNHKEEISKTNSIVRLGSKNMILFSNNEQFGFFDLNTNKKVIFEYYSKFSSSIYVQDKNEIWLNTFDKEDSKSSNYYDTVLDSTLTIKPNPIKNVLMAYEKYYFTENEKGIQVTDYNGQTSPFTYPYLTPVKNRITYDDIHPNNDIFLDKLFVFSTQKDRNIIGIINIDGKIILPEKFTNITMRHIYYYTSPSDEFRTYFKENNLENFYYFTFKNNNQEDEYTLFNKEGMEIITFKHNKNMNCSPEFDLMEKNQLQIKFHCSDSLKIYDLKTKKQIHSESNRKY